MAKRNLFSPNYTSAIIVVHGSSEEIIARHIRSNLRLNLYIHKRKTSIQIDGLLHELQTNFKDISVLNKNKHLELNISKNEIVNFKIFTLMDTDDCDEKTKLQYIDGSLFEQYSLKKYVVPIYTSPNLENVLYNCELIPRIFKNSEKVKEYIKRFPVSKAPYSVSKIDEMNQLSQALKNNKCTNMEEFIDYCIEQTGIL